MSKRIIDQAVKILNSGGLIIFPTETVYGAGVDATNQAAVNKLLKYKSRREGKPLSIAVNSIEMAKKYVILNKQAKNFYDNFLPGPFTIISKSKHKTAKGVESEFGTLGVRIPDYKLILDILKKFKKPITATSANASGKKRPYQISDILNNISQKQKNLIDFIIDQGKLPPNKPSTVIDTTLSTPVVVRKGDGEINPGGQTVQGVFNTPLRSGGETETKDIAKKICLKNWDQIKKSGLIIGLDGELGAGKTVFTKGVAEFLQIKQTITSPTYNYFKIYDYSRHGVSGQLIHVDAWKIDNKKIFDNLKLEKYLKPKNIIVIEWLGQIASREQACLFPTGVVKIAISELKNNQRQIIIHE